MMPWMSCLNSLRLALGLLRYTGSNRLCRIISKNLPWNDTRFLKQISKSKSLHPSVREITVTFVKWQGTWPSYSFLNHTLQGSFCFKTVDSIQGYTFVYRDLKIVMSGSQSKRFGFNWSRVWLGHWFFLNTSQMKIMYN